MVFEGRRYIPGIKKKYELLRSDTKRMNCGQSEGSVMMLISMMMTMNCTKQADDDDDNGNNDDEDKDVNELRAK